MPKLNFTVDSALLRELGEHLVGKPSIALAELIKNSYDADATSVLVELDPHNGGRIMVRDNGHGMTFEEFRDFWMRVGSTHKGDLLVSRRLERPLTGSKGVGRIAARILSRRIDLRTVAMEESNIELHAWLDWENTTRVKDLTEAEVDYEILEFDEPPESGTTIDLIGLNDIWTEEDIKELALEIWQLEPPFRGLARGPVDGAQEFVVEFRSRVPGLAEKFQEQMQAILKLWHAKVVGRLREKELTLSLQFKGQEARVYRHILPESTLKEVSFEVRFFYLRYRQPYGIRISKARMYLSRFGGVHIYDGGFRLPFYGRPENDWLKLGLDRARRLATSILLPEELQIPEGMEHLPHTQHLLGVVNVNTSRELDLDITITRDRLRETKGFETLKRAVRFAIDWYAMEKARRHLAELSKMVEVRKPSIALSTVAKVLDHYATTIPDPVMSELRRSLDKALETAKAEEKRMSRQVAVLGSLAAAGASAVAFQHEFRRQVSTAKRLAARLERLAASAPDLRDDVRGIQSDLEEWISRTEALGAMFGHLMDAENLNVTRRFPARKVLEQVITQMSTPLMGVKPILRVSENLILPKGTYAEWVALFQNVFYNAVNAMIDSERKVLCIEGERLGDRAYIRVLDTGVGVDLSEADVLFEPFERRLQISPERRALGYGGTGLGLTIVSMIAERRGCDVSFVEPEEDFSTSFQLEWEETR